MTGEHLNREKLQRHYDGDLSGQEAAEAQQHLGTCAQCQAELASFERLGDILRWSTQEATVAADVDFSKMFAQIEQAVEQERSGAPGSNVISLQPARSRFLQRAAPALGALAVAAAALLIVNRSEPPSDEGQVAMLDNARHSEITGVKFGKNAGQVFRVQVADNESVPVVWIDDDDDDDDDHNDEAEQQDQAQPEEE